MAFRYAAKGEVFWPVTLVQRNAETGDLTEETALIQYKYYGRSELKARERKMAGTLLTKLRAAKTDDEVRKALDAVDKADKENDAELITRIKGWKLIVDQDETPVPFSTDVLKAMLDDEALHDRLHAGLMECSRGAKAKNSSPGAAG